MLSLSSPSWIVVYANEHWNWIETQVIWDTLLKSCSSWNLWRPMDRLRKGLPLVPGGNALRHWPLLQEKFVPSMPPYSRQIYLYPIGPSLFVPPLSPHQIWLFLYPAPYLSHINPAPSDLVRVFSSLVPLMEKAQ